MGTVIRPAAFTRGMPSSRLMPTQEPIRTMRARRFNVHLAALIVAVMALAWILALAGTAFAVRAVLVLCFATLAGRARRVGVPVRQTAVIRFR